MMKKHPQNKIIGKGYIIKIPTQFFLSFFSDFDWSIGKIKSVLHFNKTHAYEYLISALIPVLIKSCT